MFSSMPQGGENLGVCREKQQRQSQNGVGFEIFSSVTCVQTMQKKAWGPKGSDSAPAHNIFLPHLAPISQMNGALRICAECNMGARWNFVNKGNGKFD